MALYSKESLEDLRRRIDLAEVIASYLPMQRSGASYKALCPFHAEKTPSFIVQKGDSHYHCFGCGAHGDAIAFLMGHLQMTFLDAIESLAERFQVPLEKIEAEKESGPSKARLKQALEKASWLYHFFLLHSEEGRRALEYLYQRAISLSFIRQFEIGYAPKQGNMLLKVLDKEGFSEEELLQAGLIHAKKKDFFSERITFPIRDKVGAVIGFSARKFCEETFGGKYINTPETPLFKKSQVLFGLCYSRSKMAKERKALIVEGQIDALRLIHKGFDYTVASQGTAFGEGHAKELIHLGVNHVFLAFDGDVAGIEAAVKVGDLFQKKGVEVTVVSLPEKSDPDSFLCQKGPEAFGSLLESGVDYLPFLYRHLIGKETILSPSKKNEIVEEMIGRIRAWEMPVLVHESLKKLSELAQIPPEVIQLGSLPSVIPQRAAISKTNLNSDLILELDLLRWLFLSGEAESKVIEIIRENISSAVLKTPGCKQLFQAYMQALEEGKQRDWLSIAGYLEGEDVNTLLSQMMQKKVNLQKAEEGAIETVRKLLERNWMDAREKIQQQIQAPGISDEEVLILTKEFGALQKPQVKLPACIEKSGSN